ncbi:MAG TPA: RNA polymerase-associated protein RapA [Terriglobia bacterium]|nr:RNA polymerase-associated protein RapA [Terriglobia bacterium]
MADSRHTFVPGQRWISESEPELGLGSILTISDRTVTAEFKASGETRVYARANAPLRRARFRVGDTVRNRAEKAVLVQAVEERDGLLFYRHGKAEICETALSDTIAFSQPEERFFAGHLDAPELFDQRLTALDMDNRRRKSSVCGFVGGRIDLIPHQLYIAHEVSERLAPRVLLADETGLGKTIEACLILHRLILTGRVQRALILVPESLVHQWFVELLRRFNLWFHIFDEDRCDALELESPGANPFQDDQLILCAINLGASNPKRGAQMEAAGWDMLVVDEAHHLQWTPRGASPEYALVESLGAKTLGVLLLTATPEQLGVNSHFARLRLLDPDRFYDLDAFIRESGEYREVAMVAETLLDGRPFTEKDAALLVRILGESGESIRSRLNRIADGDHAAYDDLLDDLLDCHGVGRVRFRNTRATIAGFPKRVLRLSPLDAPADAVEDGLMFEQLAEEFALDTDREAAEAEDDSEWAASLGDDPRIEWLIALLRSLPREKILVICSRRSKVIAIEAALRRRIHVKLAVFHEELSLIQRDRNAAWFADPDGARVLISSEIGGEGRNFQFARHLALFDLPLDPELLEQRIGRLDRIGQTSEIQIHVPYTRGSAQEVLARWHHEGLNGFERHRSGARELLERFGMRVYDLCEDFHERAEAGGDLDRIIAETVQAREEIASRLSQGRDRLLDLNSFRPGPAADLATAIRRGDEDQALDRFMLTVFDRYAIGVEEIARRTYHLGSAGILADTFPGLPADGFTVTRDRRRALAREDIQFLTWDHPLAVGAIDLVLGSEKGNSAFARWPDARVTALYVEAIYVLEAVAPPQFHVDRFLPPTPIRVIVDQKGNDVAAALPTETLIRKLKHGDGRDLVDEPTLRDELLPRLLARTLEIAQAAAPAIVERAREEMVTRLEHEVHRLRELRKINPSVRPAEIELVETERRNLDARLAGARLRLDAIRLIQRGA